MTLFGYKPSTLILWVILALPALGMLPALTGGEAQPATRRRGAPFAARAITASRPAPAG